MFKKFFALLKSNKVTIKSRKFDLGGYSKSMEKHKRKNGNEYFELPFDQKRYDEIVNTLKYTNHSKRRDKLLRTKKIYDDIILERNK